MKNVHLFIIKPKSYFSQKNGGVMTYEYTPELAVKSIKGFLI
jgi:hypothetical protein